MLEVRSGESGQYIHFVAVDATDLSTRETTGTGLTIANISVVRARGGATDATYNTPTIAEIDSSTMPGVYSLLLDEDMTITSGKRSELVSLHIKDSGGVMAPVTVSYMLVNDNPAPLSPLTYVLSDADTSPRVYVYAASKVDGTPKTGLAYTGPTAYYSRMQAASAPITLATQTVTGAYASGGFVELDATNMPGWYRFDVPTAINTSGVRRAAVSFKMADVMFTPIELEITAYDPNAAGADPSTIADAVLDEALSAHTTAGSLGKAIADIETDATAILADTGTDGVVVASVGAGAITATSLASDTITAAKIASNAITDTKIAAGAIAADAFAAGAIDATAIAADAIDASALAADAANEIADAILARNVSGGSSTGRTVKQALHAIRNKVTKTGGTITVYDTDDVSSSWTASYTTASENPVDAVDPA